MFIPTAMSIHGYYETRVSISTTMSIQTLPVTILTPNLYWWLFPLLYIFLCSTVGVVILDVSVQFKQHCYGSEDASACALSSARAKSFIKYFEASMTIAVGGMDIDIAFFVRLRKFIQKEYTAGLWSITER